MSKLLPVAAALSVVTASVVTLGAATPAAAAGCATRTEIVKTSVTPRTVVLGVAQPKGIEAEVDLRQHGCRVDRVELGLYGPNFVDTYELDRLGSQDGVTTYDTGLRIAPGDLGNSEAGAWRSYVTVTGQASPEQAGPGFRILRAARLSANATPEPVTKGATLTVSGRLTRADWQTLSYRAYGGRKVRLQRRTGAGAYRTVATVTSGSDGRVRAAVTATATACYRFVFAGSSTTAAVRSAADCVTARR